ncbi:MAG: murein L,D-transpeptidase [Hyphomicrobiaceae bacterium]|nr:murein L,D-transpeptidase [Hyphomicrobiaceae bacterium]
MAGSGRLARRLGWVSGAVSLLAAGAIIVAVLVFTNLANVLRDHDQRGLALERAKRLGLWAMGLSLPGSPDYANLDNRLASAGMKLGQPVFLRIFKREFELEIWLKNGERFNHFATYPICRWSGKLGPKLKQGDHQAPEGFYWVSAKSLNPASRWHRSFNLGFPNTFDRAQGRTGSFLMVHGGCGSVGCYAMTNAAVDEIWRIVTAALDGGQKRFQVQALPFRMTPANLAESERTPNAPFWQSLRDGYDLFEQSRLPPIVRVCSGRYEATAAPAGTDGSTPLIGRCAKSDV